MIFSVGSVKKLIEIYIIGTQIWVSLMIFLLSYFFSVLNNSVDINRSLLVFFSTLAAYNYVQYQQFWKRRKISNQIVLFFIALLISLFLLIKRNDIGVACLISFLGILTVFYNSTFIKFRLRKIKFLKIFIISFIWTCVVLYIGNDYEFSFSGFFSLFLFVVGITIPFDIVDASYDTVKTLPIGLGIYKSKVLAILCLMLSYMLFLDAYAFYSGIIWLLCCVISAFLVALTRKGSFFLTRFWIEGCPGIPFFILMVLKLLTK